MPTPALLKQHLYLMPVLKSSKPVQQCWQRQNSTTGIMVCLQRPTHLSASQSDTSPQTRLYQISHHNCRTLSAVSNAIRVCHNFADSDCNQGLMFVRKHDSMSHGMCECVHVACGTGLVCGQKRLLHGVPTTRRHKQSRRAEPRPAQMLHPAGRQEQALRGLHKP